MALLMKGQRQQQFAMGFDVIVLTIEGLFLTI